jgi:hypothetical protein
VNRRYWFYLAQSYYDVGQTEKAAETYAKRAEMGGWEEEAWYARLQQARCLRALGDDGGSCDRRWPRSTSARSAPSRFMIWRGSTASDG